MLLYVCHKIMQVNSLSGSYLIIVEVKTQLVKESKKKHKSKKESLSFLNIDYSDFNYLFVFSMCWKVLKIVQRP